MQISQGEYFIFNGEIRFGLARVGKTATCHTKRITHILHDKQGEYVENVKFTRDKYLFKFTIKKRLIKN